MLNPQIIKTGDGSDTLINPEINESYHSIRGAVSESTFVFLKNGYLQLKEKKRITILEIGFGTGLNCLLTALAAGKRKLHTHYFSLEKFPLSREFLNKLNYEEITGEIGDGIFNRIHSAPWNVKTEISSWFDLVKMEDDFLTSDLSKIPLCDLIYFDAFSPGKQPDMWKADLLEKLYDKMAPGALFVTYSARGSLRRDLVRIGYTVERLPGPEGKREMLRGLKL